MNQNQVCLREVVSGDEIFLFRLYASTRAAEMALVNWSPLQKDTFLQMQFNAQRRSYAVQFPDAYHQIVLVGDQPVGRIIIQQTSQYFLLIDLAILPEARGQGIGTHLIRSLQAEASQAGLPVHLHVETFNPAQALYERLGFRKTSLEGIYIGMEWQPALTAAHPLPQTLDSMES